MKFDKSFLWGCATASYQIEGGWNEDGKGKNIWDEFCEREGVIRDGDHGRVACDHYHLYQEDVEIMKQLGLKAYRFSVSWARLIPDGVGEINEKGIDFYNNLIDALLEAGIEPVMTLYHWDLPLALQHKGGWQNPEIKDWFYEYAKLIAQRFSDRVKKFITINEPVCVIGVGLRDGNHAPGFQLSSREVLGAAHNLLTAHGYGVKALREYAKQPIEIGIAPNFDNFYPLDETKEGDVNAAREKMFAIQEKPEMWIQTANWWLDPIVKGRYPALTDAQKAYLPKGYEKDMEDISRKIDFICFNLYSGTPCTTDENGTPVLAGFKAGHPRTSINWKVAPDSLKWNAKFLYERYQMPLYISENGMACHDGVSLDGRVHDANRIDYMNRYLLKLGEAIQEGACVKGYFVWSLMDNFEWAEGYNERFGIVYVDYETQKRTIKDSGYWYRDVIQSNGEIL